MLFIHINAISVCEDIECCDGSIVCDVSECPSFTTSGKLEVCFVLDESGSVCSKTGYVRACTSSGRSSTCEYNGLNDKAHRDFCPKFNTNTKDFVTSFMESMDATAAQLGATTKYAVATFSSNADKDQTLQNTATTVNTVRGLTFEGGYTQTAEGMAACQDLLQNGDPDADKLMVLVTDGRPRQDSRDLRSYMTTTRNYATNIKMGKEADGRGSAPPTKIIAIGVETTDGDLSFVQQLASPGYSFEFDDGYEALGTKVKGIVSGAIQSTCGTTLLTVDECPDDPLKTEPGECGCGVQDTDMDGDGFADCIDKCPDDGDKIEPGLCGCGTPETDTDSDGTPDCNDGCHEDPDKTEPGICGCGEKDTDTDDDGTADCIDKCPKDPSKVEPGICGCGEEDTDTDGDGTADCIDKCPGDPDKTEPGECGCGTADTDSDNDGVADCGEGCPNDPKKSVPGICGCGTEDKDSDGDGTMDCNDECPKDPNKTEPGECGCRTSDVDSDGDGTVDCNDGCPDDSSKTEPGKCGCGSPDTDSDNDGTPDCLQPRGMYLCSKP